MINIPTLFKENVSNTIDRYSLLNKDKNVVLAYSGGKDSSFALLCLSQLGYNVIPVVVDIGLDDNWADRVVSLSHLLENSKVVVLNINKITSNNDISVKLADELISSIEIVKKMLATRDRNVTPCTKCYNAKMIMLSSFAKHLGSDRIVMAHNGTDVVSSMLKNALMYIDRWDNNNEKYQATNFELLVGQLKYYFENTGGDLGLMSRIAELAEHYLTTTDEPPLQKIGCEPFTSFIVRPFGYVFEHDIVNFWSGENMIFEPPDCGRNIYDDWLTPRELIKRRAIDISPNNTILGSKLANMLKLCQIGLKNDGTLIFNTRNNRDNLLGQTYRRGIGSGIKY